MGIIARQGIKASVVGLVGVAIGGISKLFVFTHFLSAEEIGLLDVITKLTLLLITFFVLGTPQVIQRYFSFFESDKKDGKFVNTYLKILFASILMSTVLYLALQAVLIQLYIDKAPLFVDYLNVPLVCSILYAFYLFFNSISIARKRIVVPTLLYQVINRSLVILVVLMYSHFKWLSLNGFIYYYVLAFFAVPLIGILIYVLGFLKINVEKTSFEESKSIFATTKKYNLFLILSMASGYVIQAVDAQMIGASLGLASVGIYSIAFYMGVVIEIPKRAIGNISFPILIEEFAKNNIKKVREIYQNSAFNQFFVGAFLFLLVWCNIDVIFMIIPNGESFAVAKYVVLFVGIGKLVDMSTGVNRQIIEVSPHYKYNLVINFILGVSVIGLNFIFIPLDHFYIGGIGGAAFASMLAMFISNIIAMIIVWKHYKIQPFNPSFLGLFIWMLITYICVSVVPDFSNIKINFLAENTIIIVSVLLYILLFKKADFLKIYHSMIK